MIRPFQVGDRVTYIPYKNAPKEQWKNGIIKLIPSTEYMFIVFNCNDDWEDYFNYTGQCTSAFQVFPKWKEDISRDLGKKYAKLIRVDETGTIRKESPVGFTEDEEDIVIEAGESLPVEEMNESTILDDTVDDNPFED